MTVYDAHVLSQDAHAEVTAANLLERLDLERLDISSRLAVDPKRRADLGQFFTPARVAHFMAAMLRVPNPLKELRILDAGGGSGVLIAAAVAELCAAASCVARHGLGDRRAALRRPSPHLRALPRSLRRDARVHSRDCLGDGSLGRRRTWAPHPLQRRALPRAVQKAVSGPAIGRHLAPK